MAFPGIFRRLFANEGAGPLLRKEIIPFGTEEGTVCAGDDSRLAGGADWADSSQSLKAAIATLDALRIQSIGVPKYWTSTTLPADHCWPDGSLILFADRPELKAKYNAGGFEGMLLEADADADTIAANLGKWVKHPNSLGLYTPQLGGQFFRNWMLGGDREAGSWGRDEIRNIEGSTANMPNKGSTGYVGGAFTIKGLGGGAAFNDGGSAYIQHLFNASNVVPTGPQNVPQHIWQPVILYLGRPK